MNRSAIRLVFAINAVVVLSCGGSHNHAKVAPPNKKIATGEASGAAKPAASPTELAFELEGFSTPESILYDEEADLYLVSNIQGSPFDHDDNGFISLVSPDGKLLDLKWVDGTQKNITLDAPKGMAFVGNVLFVADINVVRKFDRKSGKALGTVKLPGSTFINDIFTGSDGAVYVTDSGLKPGENGAFDASGTDALYHINAKNKVTKLASGDALGQPNGVFFDGKDIHVVGNKSGEFLTLDINGKTTNTIKLPDVGLDGIIAVADNKYVVSSWGASALYSVTLPDGKPTKILGDVDAPADLGWDSKRNRILIPRFMKNKITVVTLVPKAN